MKECKKFNFDFEDENNVYYKGYIEISYTNKEKNHKTFSASGMFYEKRKNGRFIDSFGGQCLDVVYPYLKDNEIFLEIYNLWEQYHLNDMHAECVHQNEQGLREKAKKKVTIYHYIMTPETIRKQNKLKNDIKTALSNGDTVKLKTESLYIYNLPYSKKSYVKLDNEMYKLEKTEETTLGWVRTEEYEEGLIGKKCPVCGYKYGSGWVYFPIPKEDEEKIYKLLEM